jgi:hypothetical protein
MFSGDCTVVGLSKAGYACILSPQVIQIKMKLLLFYRAKPEEIDTAEAEPQPIGVTYSTRKKR